MSNVSGFHDVLVYNGKQKAGTNQRLSVVAFKTPSDRKDDPTYKRPDARCVSVPKLELSVTPQILKDSMQQALEDLQDAAIRKIVVAAIDEGKNVITVHDSQIGFESIAEFAKLEAANGKLNKDLIEDWFDSDIGDELTLALASAMKVGSSPTPEQEKKIAAAVTNYKSVFKSLAAPKAGLSPKIAQQMQKALVHAKNKEDRVYKALSLKLTASLDQKDPELVGL
jgi:hypothetical protein